MRKVHFVAIGGQSMSGIARILISKGFEISGSDIRAGSTTERLSRLGARIYIGHRRENVEPRHSCRIFGYINDNGSGRSQKKRDTCSPQNGHAAQNYGWQKIVE